MVLRQAGSLVLGDKIYLPGHHLVENISYEVLEMFHISMTTKINFKIQNNPEIYSSSEGSRPYLITLYWADLVEVDIRRIGEEDQTLPTLKIIQTLERLVDYTENQVCQHDETHRGGFLWEICDQCGAKWADDQGGKPKFAWPKPIAEARELLLQIHFKEPNHKP